MTQDRSRGSRKQPRKFQDSSESVHSRTRRTFFGEFNARCPRSTSECSSLHACKACKALGKVCRVALLPALAPRHLLLLQMERRSGRTRRRDRWSRIGGSDTSLPLAPWKALGDGAGGNLDAWKDYQFRCCVQPSPLAHSDCRSPPSTWISLIRT